MFFKKFSIFLKSLIFERTKNDFFEKTKIDKILYYLKMLKMTNLLIKKDCYSNLVKIREIYSNSIKKEYLKTKNNEIEKNEKCEKKQNIENFNTEDDNFIEIQHLAFNLTAEKANKKELSQKLKNIVLKVHSKYYLGPKQDIKKNLWIIKPSNSTRGQNIKVFREINQISSNFNKIISQQQWIIQKYIENPLLIHNKKFDVRFYVLVTCLEPFTIWYYDDYYIRLSPVRYNDENISDLGIHLTNFSISKKIEVCKEEIFPERMINKTTFLEYVESQFGKEKRLKVEKNILKTVKSTFSIFPELISPRDRSFEIMGLDLMIDQEFKVWVLEANISPSMECGTSITKEIIPKLTDDLLKIIIDDDFGKMGRNVGKWKILEQRKMFQNYQEYGVFEKNMIVKSSKIANLRLI